MKKPFNALVLCLLPLCLLSGCNTQKEGKVETLEEAKIRLAHKKINVFDNSDKIIFKNFDGSVLNIDNAEDTYAYNLDVPTRPADDKYHYEFSNWNVTYDQVEKATIAKAEYLEILNEYEIKFMDGDKLISSQMVKYGQLPVVPEGFEANETIKEVTSNRSYHQRVRLAGETYTNGLVFEMLDGKEEFAVMNYYGSEENIVIPSTYLGINVTTIVKDAFKNAPDIKTIYIPNTINNIEPNAFRGISSLTSLTLQEGNTTYSLDGSGAIYFNEYWHQGEPNEEIYKHLLYVPSGKVDLLEISEDYFSIEDGALNCTNATILKLSTRGFLSMLDVFGEDYKTNNVKQLIITSGYLNDSLFEGMENLYSVKINEEIPSEQLPEGSDLSWGYYIGENCFKDCVNLRGISLPSQITTIESKAFANCTSLEDVVLGFDTLNIDSVQSDSFLNCDNLKGYEKDGVIYLGNSVHKYQIPVNYTKDLVEQLTIPEETLIIPDRFFENNQVLRDVIFPENSRLISIGERAFYNCLNLDLYTEEHYLPLTLEKIGDQAFSHTKLLSSDKSSWLWVKVKEGEEFTSYKFALVNLMTNCSSIGLSKYCKFIDGFGMKEGITTAINNEYGNTNFTVHRNKILVQGYRFIKCIKTMTKIVESDFTYGSFVYVAHVAPYAFYKQNIDSFGYLLKTGGYHSDISYIGDYAFYNSYLKDLYFSTYLEYVGSYAFYGGIYKATSLNIGSKLSYVGENCFVSSYRFTLNFAGPAIPETWDYNFDGYNGANTSNTYNYNVSF